MFLMVFCFSSTAWSLELRKKNTQFDVIAKAQTSNLREIIESDEKDETMGEGYIKEGSIWMGGKGRPWKTQRHGRGMGGLCCHWNRWELSVLCCNNLWVNYPYPFSEVTSIIILNFNYTKSLESIIFLLHFTLNTLN